MITCTACTFYRLYFLPLVLFTACTFYRLYFLPLVLFTACTFYPDCAFHLPYAIAMCSSTPPPPLRKHQESQESDGKTGSRCSDKAVLARDTRYQKNACHQKPARTSP